jgi:hypothetical protein
MDSQKDSLCEISDSEPRSGLQNVAEKQSEQTSINEELRFVKMKLRDIRNQTMPIQEIGKQPKDVSDKNPDPKQELYIGLRKTVEGLDTVISKVFSDLRKYTVQEKVIETILSDSEFTIFIDEHCMIRCLKKGSSVNPTVLDLNAFVSIVCGIISQSLFKSTSPVFFDMFMTELHKSIFEILSKYVPESHPIFNSKDQLIYSVGNMGSYQDSGMGGTSESSG